jgi:cysteinyl-tRNA synthetase
LIKLFNTLGRSLEEFRPIIPGEVKMYTCGPTVWNYPHIGNYRTFVFEDFLKRYLEYRGYHVTQVMNLTDVDDRIIKICKEQNLDNVRSFTKQYEDAFFDDLKFLNFRPADSYPRATDHVPDMVKIIEKLLQNGNAYKAEDGSIYYRIASFPEYGKLSGLVLSELKPGARVRVDDYNKDSAQDFALWKAWDEQDGRIFWNTSLGKGRPGWHIECSAMSMKYLGEHFDIHTGGVDNIFPHHENEIAQSEAYTGRKFANYWLHADWLLINDQKMAKRLGNFITVKQLRDDGVSGSALRLLFLSSHYRTQQNFTEQSLAQATASVRRLNEFVERLRSMLDAETSTKSDHPTMEKVKVLIQKARDNFTAELDNDLDTPQALATVYELVTEGNKILDARSVDQATVNLFLDFMMADFNSVFGVIEERRAQTDLPSEARALLDQREKARKEKNWKETDALRAELLKLGVRVEDTPHGQKWKLESKPA